MILDLETQQHRPYRKPGDIPRYINIMSNHPPTILKEIPKMVEKRLSMLSSTKEIFQEEIGMYQRVLYKSSHKHELTYNPNINKKPKSRKRKITWFNPPFNLNVKTNIAAKFLGMIKRHFPAEHPLSKIFNRNTMKVSYSTTRNLTKHITKHNNKVINKNKQENVGKTCNCRIKSECPLRGECLVSPLVYQAEVKTDTKMKTYIGSAENLKKRMQHPGLSHGPTIPQS